MSTPIHAVYRTPLFPPLTGFLFDSSLNPYFLFSHLFICSTYRKKIRVEIELGVDDVLTLELETPVNSSLICSYSPATH